MEGKSDTESEDVSDDFEAQLKEVQSELYPGCTKFSSLDFLTKLMHIKMKNKWTNSSFDELLELLQSSHPEGNKIPPSHYIAKNTLKKMGLGFDSMHDLAEEFESQTQSEESNSSRPNDVSRLEKVLGTKPEYSRGIGHKPHSAPSVNFGEEKQTVPPLTQAQIDGLFQHPMFIDKLQKLITSIEGTKRKGRK